MNAAKLYAKLDADLMFNKLPTNVADAWMSACSNAAETTAIDSPAHKELAVASIQSTSAFEAYADVRDYFEAAGYTW